MSFDGDPDPPATPRSAAHAQNPAQNPSHAQNIAQIVTAAHTLTRLAAQRTRNDAPSAQWRALSVLTADGPQRLGELAAAARTTQPGMTRLVGQMAEAGLVVREHDAADSRVTIVRITAPGIAALQGWRIQLRDALEPLFADLDEQDWAVLSRAAELLSTRSLPQKAAR